MRIEYEHGDPIPTPEQRTLLLWNKDYSTLEQVLKGKIVIVDGTPVTLRIDDTKGWSIPENDGKYRKGIDGVTCDTIGNGTLWAYPDPRFKKNNIRVPLIGATDNGTVGALIQIRGASVYNAETGEYQALPSQTAFVEQLSLGANDTGRLVFKDNTDVLYFIKDEPNARRAIPEATPQDPAVGPFVDSTEANNYLNKLLGEREE